MPKQLQGKRTEICKGLSAASVEHTTEWENAKQWILNFYKEIGSQSRYLVGNKLYSLKITSDTSLRDDTDSGRDVAL